MVNERARNEAEPVGGRNLFVFAVSPPTAGKTSQSQILAEKLGVNTIRGRDILPDLSSDLEVSRSLVPDSDFIPALIGILDANLGNANLVVDNIPRTRAQAETLNIWARQHAYNVHVIKLALTEDEVVQRFLDRRVCPHCGESYHPDLKPSQTSGVCDNDGEKLIQRSGDTEELVRKGYRDHAEVEEEIFSAFEESSIHVVSASGTVAEAAERIAEALNYETLRVKQSE